jgi:hypothetical protein
MLRFDEDHSVYILQPPLSERDVPVGCLGHRFCVCRSIYWNLFQSDICMQAPCSQLEPGAASDSNLRQPGKSSPGSLTLYHPFKAPAEANSGVKGAIYIATAVMGIVTDVMLMAIPIPTIWGLQMPMKQKIGLTVIFAVGSMYARLQPQKQTSANLEKNHDHIHYPTYRPHSVSYRPGPDLGDR